MNMITGRYRRDLFLFFAILLPGSYTFGQWDIVNNSYVNPSSNILFTNFSNEVSISGKQSRNYNLVSKKRATITKLAAASFTVMPNATGIDTLQLFERDKLIYEKIFEVYTLPDFKLTLGSLKEGPASREEVILNKRLQVYFPNCKCPVAYVVSYFKLSFVSHNLAPNEKYMVIEGNTLNEKAIEVIKKLSSKDQIIFENIRLQDVSSIARQIDKFVITIK